MHFNYVNKAADSELQDLYLKKVLKKILFIKGYVFWKKKKNEIKLNYECSFELTTLKINAI